MSHNKSMLYQKIIFHIFCFFVDSSHAQEDPSLLLTSTQRVQQMREYYQQKRQIQQIAEEQKESEKRQFSPTVSYESFTLTEEDSVVCSQCRTPAQVQ